jgi:HrpA-like RNA helicase
MTHWPTCCPAQIHTDEAPGDILVFLTGEDDISGAAAAISARSRWLPAAAGAIVAMPLYAALPPAAQAEALEPAPPGVRKVGAENTGGRGRGLGITS